MILFDKGKDKLSSFERFIKFGNSKEGNNHYSFLIQKPFLQVITRRIQNLDTVLVDPYYTSNLSQGEKIREKRQFTLHFVVELMIARCASANPPLASLLLSRMSLPLIIGLKPFQPSYISSHLIDSWKSKTWYCKNVTAF
jgi:hypothetical protein